MWRPAIALDCRPIMIPKILHFCFGMSPEGGDKPWSLVHHVCVTSAIECIKPKQAFFYYESIPRGPWWALTRNLVTPVKVRAPREIFGNPLIHPAHRADVLRLEKLLEHGGKDLPGLRRCLCAGRSMACSAT